MLKKHAPLIVLILIGLAGTKALFQPGFYSSHDGEHQIVRQYIFDRAIKAGHIPPRFDRQLHNHLGYPLLTFTYQLPFWLGEPFVLMGFPIQDAVKIVFILTYIASGLTMYLFAEERWGKLAGATAAFLYLWAPYRFSTILVRASLGEHTAFVFLPLLLWSLSPKGGIRVVTGAISIFGLLLSHSMFAQLSAIPVILFWLADFWRTKNKLPLILNTLYIILLGLGLSAYYFIPAMYYRSAIQGLNSTFYAEHFVTIKQLIYSKWGYTFSQFGTANDGMSFQIGLAHWIAVILSLLFIVRSRTAIALLISFILSVFLMTDGSSEIWRKLVSNSFVLDLPWRLLANAVFIASALAGFIISNIQKKSLRTILFILLILIALYTNRNHLRINERQDFDQNFLTSFTGTSNSYDEYQSVYTDISLLKRPTNPSVEVTEGSAAITIQTNQPHQLVFSTESTTSSRIRINTVYFPGWQLFIDNQPVDTTKLAKSAPDPIIPAGRHTVSLLFKETPIMQVADLISLLSAVIMFIIVIHNFYVQSRRRHAGI